MKDIKLLDCTMRDGGYLNDWRFGHGVLVSVFRRLVDAGVDIIEVGFLDERRPFDIDRSIMPDSSCAGEIFSGLEKKQAIVVGMIDYGTCSIDRLRPCEESFLDGIRVIFKKHVMREALEYCRRVKALGYKVFAQLVSITSYSDEELIELTGLVNDVEPYAVSIVDTYGLMHTDELLHYYEILDEHVSAGIRIGFHAHNNFQMAYANSLAFVGRKTERDIIVDGTLYGMGKSAGNAPIELLAMRLNEKYAKSYNVASMLESIEECLMDIYSKTPWGYKLFYYMCAKNRCHPNYLSYFSSRHDLSTSKLDEIMSMIEPEASKLLYDKKIAQALYDEYDDGLIDEKEEEKRFLEEISGRELLIVGPGKNIQLQQPAVLEFIEKADPYIISINYIPKGFAIDCVFVTNSKRYREMVLELPKASPKTLATTNVECRNGRFDFVVHRAPLLEEAEEIMDNSFMMLVKLLLRMGVKRIFCAGFDGYSDKEDNYHDPAMEYIFVKKEASHLNYYMRRRIAEFRKAMDIEFITFSAYDQVDDINRASI